MKEAVYQYLEELGYSNGVLIEEGISLLKILYKNKLNLTITWNLSSFNELKNIKIIDDYSPERITSINIYTNGKDFIWFAGFLRIPPVHFNQIFKNEIIQIHNKIFILLHQKHQQDNNFKFRVRQKNTRKRLKKGYWFTGNDDYLVVSFWAGGDAHNKTPYIYFHIDMEGSMILYFVAKTSEKLGEFYEKELVKVLGLKAGKKDENGRVLMWSKSYYHGFQGDYLKVLAKFIDTEKIIIDKSILIENLIHNNDLDGLRAINADDFKKSLDNVLKYQDEKRVAIELETYSNTPIEPSSLTIENIGRFSRLDLDIYPKIVCFLGENGSGKTTILRSLLLALTGTEDTTLIDTTDLRFQRMLKINDVEENGNIKYQKSGKIELSYSHNDTCASTIHFQLKNDNVIIEDSDHENTPSFTTTYDNDFYTQLIIGFSQVQGKGKHEEVKPTLNPIQKANVRDILPLLYDTEDNRFNDLSKWIIGLFGEAQKNKKTEEHGILDEIFKIISEITDTKIKLLDVNFLSNIIWIKLNDEEPILFSLLSQGYKNVFAWVGHFMRRLAEANEYNKDFMKQPAILAIDEIDTYLHPKWQRNILNVLAKHFSNTRFFITTHSPLVANYFKGNDITVYVLEGNEARKIDHIYGTELSRAYYSWMGIASRPQAVQQQISELFKLLDQEKVKEAQVLYKSLSSMLGKQDADMVEAKTELDLIIED